MKTTFSKITPGMITTSPQGVMGRVYSIEHFTEQGHAGIALIREEGTEVVGFPDAEITVPEQVRLTSLESRAVTAYADAADEIADLTPEDLVWVPVEALEEKHVEALRGIREKYGFVKTHKNGSKGWREEIAVDWRLCNFVYLSDARWRKSAAPYGPFLPVATDLVLVAFDMTERMTPEQFRAARAAIGLSVADLSNALEEATGRSQRADTIRKWESGASLIPYGVPADLLAVAEKRKAEIEALINDLAQQ